MKLRFTVTPLILASVITSAIPRSWAQDDGPPSTEAGSLKCSLMAAQIPLLSGSCATGNATACLSLAVLIEKYSRECRPKKNWYEQGKDYIDWVKKH